MPEGSLDAGPVSFHQRCVGGGKSGYDLTMNRRRVGPAQVPPIPSDTIREIVAVFAVGPWTARVSGCCATAASDGAEVFQRFEFPFEGAVPT